MPLARREVIHGGPIKQGILRFGRACGPFERQKPEGTAVVQAAQADVEVLDSQALLFALDGGEQLRESAALWQAAGPALLEVADRVVCPRQGGGGPFGDVYAQFVRAAEVFGNMSCQGVEAPADG